MHSQVRGLLIAAFLCRPLLNISGRGQGLEELAVATLPLVEARRLQVMQQTLAAVVLETNRYSLRDLQVANGCSTECELVATMSLVNETRLAQTYALVHFARHNGSCTL